MNKRDWPLKEVWIDPHCEDCYNPAAELTWCHSPDQPDCEECGREPIRYTLNDEENKPKW